MISIKENVNSVEEFNYLYDAVGWGSYDKKVSEKALASCKGVALVPARWRRRRRKNRI